MPCACGYAHVGGFACAAARPCACDCVPVLGRKPKAGFPLGSAVPPPSLGCGVNRAFDETAATGGAAALAGPDPTVDAIGTVAPDFTAGEAGGGALGDIAPAVRFWTVC